MQKIGRNDPCPCGSGEKYKKCCWTAKYLRAKNNQETDYFTINKDIAYRGKLGQRRKAFCIDYMKTKKDYLSLIEKEQVDKATEAGKTISCHKGCSFCCSTYVQASIQECEAIIYYLYKNDAIIRKFLSRYMGWREAIRRNGDLFKQCSRFWKMDVTPENRQFMEQQFKEENRRYYQQDIACPFLSDGICSIYEVRPYMCAALVSVSPSDWCKPHSYNIPEQLRVYPSEVEYDLSFYYGELGDRVLSYMPLTVYEILKNGTYYFSRTVPYLKDLDRDFCSDSEVSSVLRKYSKLHYRRQA
ncbi:SEC-C metal-binding domain-containing protein [Chloroflexota bacterium]